MWLMPNLSAPAPVKASLEGGSKAGSYPIDEDVRFIGNTLNLSANRIRPPLFALDEATITQQLSKEKLIDPQDVEAVLSSQGEDILLIEGPGDLEEGALFGLSLPDMAQMSNASVIFGDALPLSVSG